MKSLTRIMLLVALAVLPMLAASPAQAAKKMEVALQDDGVFLYNEHYDRELAYRQLRELGVTHLRMNILWWQPIPEGQRNQRTKPSPIVYDFSVWDDAIARARAYGIKVQLDLAGDPPAWACGNKKVPYECDGFKPNRALFAHFVRGGGQPLPGQGRALLAVERAELVHVDQPAQAVAAPLPQALPGRLQGGQEGRTRRPRSSMGELAPHFQPGHLDRRRSSSSARWCA